MKEGWEYKTFKDQFSINMGKTPPRGDSSSWDKSKITTNKWVSIADISLNEGKIIFDTKEYISDKAAEKIKKVKAGSLLMSFKLTIGKMAFAGDDLFTNEAIIAIPQNEDYDLHFLYYYLLQYDWRTLTEGNEKVKGATLNKQSIGKIQLPIISMDEQRRIVSYLDSSFKLIDEIKNKALKSLTEAKALFQSALAEAMEPKEGWEEKTLGEICLIVGRIGFRGYTRKDIVTNKKDGAITLSPSNIVNGNMCYNNCTYISWFKYNESPEIKIQNGDILMVKTGSSYGKSAFVENLPHKATINPQFVVLKDIKINHKFLSYQLKTKKTYKYINSIVSGSAIPTFSQANLSKMLISLPPLSTQKQIVSRLDKLSSKVRAIEEKYQKMVEECDALKQAMLRDVFE